MPIPRTVRSRGLFVLPVIFLLALLALWVGNSSVEALPPAPGSSGFIERVSVSKTGLQGNQNSFSFEEALSADGRYVVFGSHATNLVAGDTNAQRDIFVFDRRTGLIERVSLNSTGDEGNFGGISPSISADGRYVAFNSDSTNLVAGDTNGRRDMFVHDRQTGVTERVSVDSSGTEGNGNSFDAPSLSPDGRYVAFDSDGSNLVAGDSNAKVDIFVHDRQTGTTERVSVDSAGAEANGASSEPSISSGGRYVAFLSAATNLVTGDTNAGSDIFVHDRQTGKTERVSVDSSGAEGNSGSVYRPRLTFDGRYVAFDSAGSNLVPGDSNAKVDIFVHDRQTGTTERVSVDSSGTEGNGNSFDPSISADGRYVAFASQASNLVAGDTNVEADIFVHDQQTGITERVSVDSSGGEGDDSSSNPGISSNGRYVSFISLATNLVVGTTNASYDVFVALNRRATYCNGMAATIVGTPWADLLVGTNGPDVIVGLSGADVIQGMFGNDVICAGGGPDVVDSGPGADWVSGGPGADRINGGPGDDTILGNQQNDLILGGAGNDLIDGNLGQDGISGGPGNDTLFGGPGADILYGDAGGDLLFGNQGNDVHNCGPDSDIADGGLGSDSDDGTCELKAGIP